MRHLLPLLLGLSLLASSTVRADSSHLDRVLAARELRVCVWPDYYGNSYRNPHTQEMTGVDADMARAFAKDLGPTAPYHVTPYAYAVRPGDDAWFARLEQFVAAIKRDGRLLTSARSHKLDTIVDLR